MSAASKYHPQWVILGSEMWADLTADQRADYRKEYRYLRQAGVDRCYASVAIHHCVATGLGR